MANAQLEGGANNYYHPDDDDLHKAVFDDMVDAQDGGML